MKLFTFIFTPMYPVPCGLVVLAKDYDEAYAIASKTVTHTNILRAEEIDMSESKVVFYESGDY